jgi:hypothetical protein
MLTCVNCNRTCAALASKGSKTGTPGNVAAAPDLEGGLLLLLLLLLLPPPLLLLLLAKPARGAPW